MPSASPAASAQDLVQTLLGVASQVILPDWKALVALFPIFLAILFFAWAAFTARKFATLGPRRRAPARLQPVTPAGVHMPGGSMAPVLAALGAMGLFLGLVFGGLALWIGATLLVITLLYWLREGIRDYEHHEPATLLPAVVHEGPPPGVHMPGPSIRPLLAALGAAALFGGLVIGGWVLVLAIVFLVWTLLGWLVDATAEYRKTVEADRTGHLENIPARRFPTRSLQVFAVLFALLALWQLGIFPPAGPATAGGPGGSPAASAAPGGGGAPPEGSIPLVAQGFAFDKKEITVPAGQPFTIFLENKDGPGTPHDVEIRTADGKPIKAVPPTEGGQSLAYEYDALEPGDYTFICSIHPIPAMTGTLKVQ
ncbi:MAG TPA: plastocyanin/azurin family copper-binding protein [Candidatus Limnocylindrales bacterium]|nr:plastocyanin/azurin family copper-binding protein [Candidatus Limnocylindrales bacterium]